MSKACIHCGVTGEQRHNSWCPTVHQKTLSEQSINASIAQMIAAAAPLPSAIPPVPIRFVSNVLKFEGEASWEENGIFRRDLAPGSATWCEGNKAIDFVCPCGCGVVHAIPVCRTVKEPRCWLWDGNVEKPTLSPSIKRIGGCGWHGFLTKGVFETCSDWRPPA